LGTEHDDLDREADLPPWQLSFDRTARVFTSHRDRMADLEKRAAVRRLVPDELLHPEEPADVVVRLGNLRISELLDDGREVTRAVLQSGAVCRIHADTAAGGDGPDAPLYRLRDTIIMALVETEIWILPAGALNAL